MTSITVLAGERTIGGTLIVVEEAGARLLFDCGMAYNPSRHPFAHVGWREGHELADLILAGLVPNVPDAFGSQVSAKLASRVGPALPPSEGPMAVALSHSHLDHSHLAGCVDSDVPVYASAATARIVEMLGDFGDALGGPPRSLTVPSDETFTVGPMQVRLVPVDHDVCGARAMLIETAEGVIAYSGDLRLHGSHPDATLSFAQQARALGARVLILEGTRLGQLATADPAMPPYPEDRVEQDVAADIDRALRQVPGKLGIVLLTPENGERVEAIARAVAADGRLLVLEPRAAALAGAALGRSIDAAHAVFAAPAPSSRGAALKREEAAIEAATRTLSADDIAAAPGDFLLQISFERFAELLDIVTPPHRGVVLACNGTPLGRFDPAWEGLEWWAATLGLRILEVGCTGHAAPHDLALLAGHTGAPTVISIHSRQPELMPVASHRLLLPVRGRRYDLAAFPDA